MKNKIVLAGGSGFLGRILQRWFLAKGWEVVVLSRGGVAVEERTKLVHWDGENLGEWKAELEGARAVVNLAGRSVDCRYDRRNRRRILESRVMSTRILGEAIAQTETPPAVWLNSSTATIYQHSFAREMDEWHGVIRSTPEAKDAFSIEVARAWERTFQDCEVRATRKIAMRTAMVMGGGLGGVFRVLRRLAALGVGGQMGDGRQFVSWIHERDFCRAVEWLIRDVEICGVVNLVAPNPLPNAEMMRVFRTTLGVPFGLNASAWMLEVGAFLMRTETELIIKSRRVVPGRLLRSGFEFEFAELRDAVADLEFGLQNDRSPGGNQTTEEVWV